MEFNPRCISTILIHLLPFLNHYTITEIENTEQYDFSHLSLVNLSYIKILSGRQVDFLFILSPLIDTTKDQGFYLNAESSEAFGETLLDNGINVSGIEFKDEGKRDLSNPVDAWKSRKIILTLENKDKKLYVVLPIYYFIKLFNLAGLSYVRELNAKSLENNFQEVIQKIEVNLLYEKNQLFFNPFLLFDNLEKKNSALILNRLLNSGYIDYSHLASLGILFPEHSELISLLSEKINKQVVRVSKAIRSMLLNENLRIKWEYQFLYYFHNVLSWFIYIEKKIPKFDEWDFRKYSSLTEKITDSRFQNKNSFLAMSTMIKKIIENGQQVKLVSKYAKNFIIQLTAYGIDLELDNLYSRHSSVLEDEIREKVSRVKDTIRNNSFIKNQTLLTNSKVEAYDYLETELIASYKTKENPNTIELFYEKLQGFGITKITKLYNQLGFENFTYMFEVYKYLPSSPIREEIADEFIINKIQFLPMTQRSIVEDIYFERINKNRVIGKTFLENKFKNILNTCFALEQMSYI